MGESSGVGMLGVGESHRGVVHRAYYVACVCQQAVDASAFGSHRSAVVVLLATENGLLRHQMGIGAAPSAWNGATVEVDENLIFGSVLEDVGEVLHGVLFVALEEVNLHTFHTNAFQPGKLLTPTTAVLHFLIVGVIPKHGIDSSGGGIPYGIFHSTAIAHLFPFPVEQHVRPTHCHGQIYVALAYLIVFCAVVICPIHPCGTAWLDEVGVLNRTRLGHIFYECRFDNRGEAADDHHTPWTCPSTLPCGIDGAHTIAFRSGGICDLVLKRVGVVVKVRRAI